jgi:hypothetical protein
MKPEVIVAIGGIVAVIGGLITVYGGTEPPNSKQTTRTSFMNRKTKGFVKSRGAIAFAI